MKKEILFGALIGLSAALNAATSGINNPQLVAMAVQNGAVNAGTDSETTSFPSAGMNTAPTQYIGTNATTKVNPHAPFTKPGQAPSYGTAPAYAPTPANISPPPPPSPSGNATQ